MNDPNDSNQMDKVGQVREMCSIQINSFSTTYILWDKKIDFHRLHLLSWYKWSSVGLLSKQSNHPIFYYLYNYYSIFICPTIWN